MMKKIFGILALIFLMIVGMKPDVMAQTDVQMNLNMFKDVSSGGETYGFSAEIQGDLLKNVARIIMRNPKGRRLFLNNTLNLTQVFWAADQMTLDELNLWFPEGDYRIDLSPRIYGSRKVPMTHNFPSIPGIIYPPDGAVEIPLNIIVAWGSLTDIVGLRLKLRDHGGLQFGIDLPTNATAYPLPINLLKANTRYELSLEARVTDFIGNGLVTTATISFTTTGIGS